MSTLRPVNYANTLLAAAEAAEESYNIVHQDLEQYCAEAPAVVVVNYGPGSSGTKPNDHLKLAKEHLKDLKTKHKVFQSCIRTALSFPNPDDESAQKVFDLLQISKFYPTSLQNTDTDQKTAETGHEPDKTNLAERSLQAVPKISELARAHLVSIGTTLKNARS